MVDTTLRAAEALHADTGLDVEVIDLRWLDRHSLDWDTISESVRRTTNVVIVEQGARATSYGAWLADEVQRRLFDWLDQPVQRVTGGIASPSISKVLEAAALAQEADVVAALGAIATPARRPRTGSPEVPTLHPDARRRRRCHRGGARRVAGRREGVFVAGQTYAVIETDKAVVDLEAETDGSLVRTLVAGRREGRGR